MKRIALLAGVLLFFVFYGVGLAATTSSHLNPYRQTLWNDLTDSIHTMGQTPQKARLTKMKLHAQRTQARLNSINAAEHAKWLAQRKAWMASPSSSQMTQ